ncbi:MAG: OmpA family protein, partial [Rhodothermales bacterium]|nr:OmpA family protein [Rhodothermales bacterium]
NAAEDDAIIISGNTDAESGQIVTVELTDGNSTVSAPAPVQSDGSWAISATDISGFNDGPLSITADVSDIAGNSAVQAKNSLMLDNDLPALTAGDLGPVNNSTPILTGTTDEPAGATVVVTDTGGNPVCTALVISGFPDNTWACEPTNPLSEGVYSLTASISDVAGNISITVFMVDIDLDADDDGIPDNIEGTLDSDGDGIQDYLDIDSDNDGIPDSDEDTGLPVLSGIDSDGDNIDDAIDVDYTAGLDTDGDGIDDAFVLTDTDKDGIPNHLDSDSDGDGIADIIEGAVDTDLDGKPNYLDTDSDNDGIPDNIEDTASPILTGSDIDNDGIDDALDVDESAGTDANGNGIDDAFEPQDTDGDGIPDQLDPDSDDDGLPDALEAGVLPLLVGSDDDADGIDDAMDVDSTGGSDTNGNGVDDALEPLDTDGDGIPDYQEIDSDSDGILDGTEADVSGLDADGDNIDDAYDLDGGAEYSINGIAAIGATDTDSDGVPDYRDLDSDNDGLSDVTEAGLTDINGDGFADNGVTTSAPPNSDGTDASDYRDLDSDNNGTYDITESNAKAFDGDGDGQIDPSMASDTDGDGVPDVVDGEPTMRGIGSDTDGDGVPNSQDLDDDNDGIPDSVESRNAIDVDSDGDGIIDRLDLDSDNDGLPDSLEGAGSADGDADGDGVLDELTDSNSDGLADSVSPNMVPVDTDGDNAPDYIDLDSDADGITDLAESVKEVSTLDSDGNGMLDSTVDTDGDGLIEVVDPVSGGAVPGTPHSLFDLDGDGFLDYQDVDSDGDGFTDTLENGDFDGDGIQDRSQSEGELKTAVSGIGRTSAFILGSLVLLIFVRRLGSRAIQAPLVVTLGVCIVFTIVSPSTHAETMCQPGIEDNEFPDCWYVMGGIGITEVDPEGEANSWRTTGDNSEGLKLSIGYHFKPHWLAELSYTDAGAAELGNLNPAIGDTAEISYDIPALFLGYWLREPEQRLNAFGKVGISGIRNAASDERVPFENQTSVQLAFGIGAQWRIAPRWFARVEWDAFDRDANYVGLAIGAYLGGRDGSEKPAPVVEPVAQLSRHPASQPKLKPESSPTIQQAPAMNASQAAAVDVRLACNAFDRIDGGVQFLSNSDQLTSSAKLILTDAAQLLRAAPGSRIEVRAHTDSQGSESNNLSLSKRRARAVVIYLMSQGVLLEQLSARGYGETIPIASNSTSEGRAQNRRVEFIVLDNDHCLNEDR